MILPGLFAGKIFLKKPFLRMETQAQATAGLQAAL
jgi:hypothetical protein